MKSSHILTTLLPLLITTVFSYSVHKSKNLETTAIQSQSSQIILIATVQVTSGLENRFRNLTREAFEYVIANEPGSLQFNLLEGSGMGEFTLFERYASQEAFDLHINSDNYMKLFQTFTDEGILVGAPVLNQLRGGFGFSRGCGEEQKGERKGEW